MNNTIKHVLTQQEVEEILQNANDLHEKNKNLEIDNKVLQESLLKQAEIIHRNAAEIQELKQLQERQLNRLIKEYRSVSETLDNAYDIEVDPRFTPSDAYKAHITRINKLEQKKDALSLQLKDAGVLKLA